MDGLRERIGGGVGGREGRRRVEVYRSDQGRWGDGHIYLPVLATPLIWRWTRQKRIEEGLEVGEPCGCGGGRWSAEG